MKYVVFIVLAWYVNAVVSDIPNGQFSALDNHFIYDGLHGIGTIGYSSSGSTGGSSASKSEYSSSDKSSTFASSLPYDNKANFVGTSYSGSGGFHTSSSGGHYGVGVGTVGFAGSAGGRHSLGSSSSNEYNSFDKNAFIKHLHSPSVLIPTLGGSGSTLYTIPANGGSTTHVHYEERHANNQNDHINRYAIPPSASTTYHHGRQTPVVVFVTPPALGTETHLNTQLDSVLSGGVDRIFNNGYYGINGPKTSFSINSARSESTSYGTKFDGDYLDTESKFGSDHFDADVFSRGHILGVTDAEGHHVHIQNACDTGFRRMES